MNSEEEKIERLNKGRKGVNERDLVGLSQSERIELIRKHAKYAKGKETVEFIRSTEELDAFERFKKKYYTFRGKFLYRGSTKKNLKEIHPQINKRFRPEEIKLKGKCVHSAEDKKTAAYYTLDLSKKDFNPKDTFGYWLDDNQKIFVISDQVKFKKKDKGGSIYKFKKNKWWRKSTKGLHDRGEWITKRKVSPVEEVQYNSTIDAMIDAGVKVYIPPKKLLWQMEKNIDTEVDKGKSLRTSIGMLKKIKSENEKRRIRKNGEKR